MSSESAAPLPTQFALPDGTFLPAVGLGTFQSDAGNSKVREAVSTALKLGYRHIDGAAAYGNEREVGEGLRDSGIPREEIFLTSKLCISPVNGFLRTDSLLQVPELAQALRCRSSAQNDLG